MAGPAPIPAGPVSGVCAEVVCQFLPAAVTGLHVQGACLHVPGVGLHVVGAGLHVPGAGLQVLGAGPRVPGAGLWVWAAGLHVGVWSGRSAYVRSCEGVTIANFGLAGQAFAFESKHGMHAFFVHGSIPLQIFSVLCS